MDFWIIDNRDVYMRQCDLACSYEIAPPLISSASGQLCPECGSSLAPRRWESPHKIVVQEKECGDLIQGAAFELIVSARFVKMYQESNLVGLEKFDQVDITPKLGEYFVTRPSVAIFSLDERKSQIKWRIPPTCRMCRLGVRKSIRGVYFGEGKRDNLDVFMASGLYSVIIVSNRFREFVVHNGLTNFGLVRAESYSDEIGGQGESSG